MTGTVYDPNDAITMAETIYCDTSLTAYLSFKENSKTSLEQSELVPAHD